MKKKRFSKSQFSRRCVIYCLAMCTIITFVVLWRAELTAGVVGTLTAIWGGELLLLMLKRLYGETTEITNKSEEGSEEAPI